MVTMIPHYQTSDGKTFEDEVVARAHEAYVANAAAIEVFLDRHYPLPTDRKPGPARTMAAKTLSLWLSEQGQLG